MSDVLSETGKPLDAVKPDASVTDFDRRVYAAIAKTLWLPNDFKEYMVQYLALNQPLIPVGQLSGFAQFTANANEVATSETTASDTYVDLSTSGPALTGLPDGAYVILFGTECWNDTAGKGAVMSMSVNGAAAADADSLTRIGTEDISLARGVTKTLAADGNNSLTAKYRRDNTGGTATFRNRWMIALKYANA